MRPQDGFNESDGDLIQHGKSGARTADLKQVRGIVRARLHQGCAWYQHRTKAAKKRDKRGRLHLMMQNSKDDNLATLCGNNKNMRNGGRGREAQTQRERFMPLLVVPESTGTLLV